MKKPQIRGRIVRNLDALKLDAVVVVVEGEGTKFG